MSLSPRTAVLLAVVALPLGAAAASYALYEETVPDVPAQVRIGTVGDGRSLDPTTNPTLSPTATTSTVAPTTREPAPPPTTRPRVVTPPPPVVGGDDDDDGDGGDDGDDDGGGDDDDD